MLKLGGKNILQFRLKNCVYLTYAPDQFFFFFFFYEHKNMIFILQLLSFFFFFFFFFFKFLHLYLQNILLQIYNFTN